MQRSLTASVHLLPAVAIQPHFSEKSFFMPYSSGAFINAPLKTNARMTSTFISTGIAICSMVTQKQQFEKVAHPPFLRRLQEGSMNFFRSIFIISLSRNMQDGSLYFVYSVYLLSCWDVDGQWMIPSSNRPAHPFHPVKIIIFLCFTVLFASCSVSCSNNPSFIHLNDLNVQAIVWSLVHGGWTISPHFVGV